MRTRGHEPKIDFFHAGRHGHADECVGDRHDTQRSRASGGAPLGSVQHGQEEQAFPIRRREPGRISTVRGRQAYRLRQPGRRKRRVVPAERTAMGTPTSERQGRRVRRAVEEHPLRPGVFVGEHKDVVRRSVVRLTAPRTQTVRHQQRRRSGPLAHRLHDQVHAQHVEQRVVLDDVLLPADQAGHQCGRGIEPVHRHALEQDVDRIDAEKRQVGDEVQSLPGQVPPHPLADLLGHVEPRAVRRGTLRDHAADADGVVLVAIEMQALGRLGHTQEPRPDSRPLLHDLRHDTAPDHYPPRRPERVQRPLKGHAAGKQCEEHHRVAKLPSR